MLWKCTYVTWERLDTITSQRFYDSTQMLMKGEIEFDPPAPSSKPLLHTTPRLQNESFLSAATHTETLTSGGALSRPVEQKIQKKLLSEKAQL